LIGKLSAVFSLATFALGMEVVATVVLLGGTVI